MLEFLERMISLSEIVEGVTIGITISIILGICAWIKWRVTRRKQVNHLRHLISHGYDRIIGETGFEHREKVSAANRNGFTQAWARGESPWVNLEDSELEGTVTWNGDLLGFTPGASAVTGDAEISVDLSRLSGVASFDQLESWAPGQAPGAVGSGSMWGDGDLGYTIAVRGNTFRETGGDDGILTGIFVGQNHEGATGTLEREDLTAAFGAKR